MSISYSTKRQVQVADTSRQPIFGLVHELEEGNVSFVDNVSDPDLELTMSKEDAIQYLENMIEFIQKE